MGELRHEPPDRGAATQAHVRRYTACLAAEAQRVISDVHKAKQLLMREEAAERGGYD